MLFISVEQFFSCAKKVPRLTREEEKQCAREMTQNSDARDRLIHNYLPQVAAAIRRAPQEIQTLQTVYACILTLEKGVDTFNFLQDSETFSHHLSWILRQCVTDCLVKSVK